MFGLIFGALSKFAASAIGKAVVGGAVSAIASNIGRKTVTPPPQVTTVTIENKVENSFTNTQEHKADLTAMRNDAEKSGFNPLTVLRAGGLSAYGSVTTTGNELVSTVEKQTNSVTMPSFSKQSFAGQFLGNMMTAGFDAWANQDIDRYNQQIRELELAQRQADLAYTKGLSGQLSATRYNQQPAINNVLKFGAGASDTPISVSTLDPTMDWLGGKTLDDVFAQTPVENTVSKTADNTYVNNMIQAQLFPMVTPGGNIVYVPWDPQDADLGAMLGGSLSYGAFSVFDAVKQYAKDHALSFGFNNPVRAGALQ